MLVELESCDCDDDNGVGDDARTWVSPFLQFVDGPLELEIILPRNIIFELSFSVIGC